MKDNVAETPKASPLGVKSWILFDWAGQPFYTLITTFLFAPYFVNYYIGDKVLGQAYWLYAAALGGLLVAFLSPILGAISDATGKRKPWVFVFMVIQVIAMGMLWYAKPGDQSSLWLILSAFVIATVCAEFAIVFTNSMMPELVSKEELGRLSGTAYAVGYVGGLVALIVMSGLIIASPESGKTLLGLDPVIEFDTAEREGERFVGPFSALWYLLFGLPFFFFTPDHAGKPAPLVASVKAGLNSLRETFVSLKGYRNIVLFLVARLLYVDGLAAIFAVGGIYAASLFSWGIFEQGLFGILLALAGSIGAYFGGKIEDLIGARNVILIGLTGLMIAVIGIVSTDKTHILFVVEVAAREAGSGPFSSVAERVYLGFGFLIGIFFGPIFSSSRTLMARLAPEDKMTEFFGFFAFSGKATAFLAPLIIAQVTLLAHDQRAGISTILIFLVLGFLLMLGVREGKK